MSNATIETTPRRSNRKKKADAGSTPGAMQPPQNKEAASSPAVLTLDAILVIVKRIATKKTEVGQQLSGRKGKSKLLSLVCNELRSHIGQAKKLDDGVTPTRLPQDVFELAEKAIHAFWQGELKSLVDEGEVISITKGKPSATFEVGADGAMRATGKWNARAHVQRDSREVKEEQFCMTLVAKQLQKRLDFMKGITTGENTSSAGIGKYTREEIAEVEAKLNAARHKHAECVLATAPVEVPANTPATPEKS